MTDILIRGLDAQTLRRLKARAQRNGRSLQKEAKMLLERAAGVDRDELADILDGWQERFAGRRLAESAALIREDRAR